MGEVGLDSGRVQTTGAATRPNDDPLQKLEMKDPLQDPLAAPALATASGGVQGPGEPLPHHDAIQHSFGRHRVDHVQTHTDEHAAGANRALGSLGYAQGEHVAFARTPDLFTAAHEAAHVVQQGSGLRLRDGVGHAGDPHERHADAVADKVVRGESAEALLDTYSGGGGAPSVQLEEGLTTSGGTQTHVLTEGESAWGLAAIYYGDGSLYPQIQAANPDCKWQVGDKVTIPPKGAGKTSTEVDGKKVTVEGGGGEDRSGEVRRATHDMGEIQGLDSGFARSAGAVLDALLPNVGDKGKVQIDVNIPVGASGNVKVSFEFIAEAEREGEGVKGRVQIGGGITAQTKADLYFCTVDAFARAMVFGYMEASGDSSAEMFDLLVLGLQQRVYGVSQQIANAVFDKKLVKETIRGMDEDDYVESGVGLDVSAGASIKGRGGEGEGEGGPDVKGGVKVQTGKKLMRGHGTDLEETPVSQVEVSVSGKADPFEIEGKLTAKWEEGEFAALEGELSGKAPLDGEKLEDLVMAGEWFSGTITQLGSIIGGGAGLLEDHDAARKAGGLARFVLDCSGVGMVAKGASKEAIEKLEGMGVEVSHKLTLKGAWEKEKGYSLQIDLERSNEIKYGEDEKALVYVLVENVQRVFRIKIGG